MYTLQLNCLCSGKGVTGLPTGCSVSIGAAGCSELRSSAWSLCTGSPRWRCQQKALRYAQSGPRVAETSVPCKWLLLCSTSHELLSKHSQRTGKQVSFHTDFFKWRYINTFNYMTVKQRHYFSQESGEKKNPNQIQVGAWIRLFSSNYKTSAQRR